jgi:hypothetical protein
VAQWKEHKLSGPPRDGLDLALHDRVKAKVDLDGVPAGMGGTVQLTGGFNWLRYHVLFENGIELTFLDDRHIEALPKRFGRRH